MTREERILILMRKKPFVLKAVERSVCDLRTCRTTLFDHLDVESMILTDLVTIDELTDHFRACLIQAYKPVMDQYADADKDAWLL